MKANKKTTVDSRLLMFNDLRFEQPLKATPRPKAIDKSRNSNQDGRGSVVHIDLQLSGKCSVPTLYRKVLDLIERLDGGSLRVAGIHVGLPQSQPNTCRGCEDPQEYDTFYDKY